MGDGDGERGAVVCLACLTADAARLRVDRRGRPYTRCMACGATTFMPSAAGLRGLSYLAPHVIEWLRSAMQADPSLGQRLAMEPDVVMRPRTGTEG
jgi:hypothetical protein